MATGTCAISKWRRLPLFSAQQGLETWFVIQIGRIVTQPPILKLVIIKAIQSSQTKDFLKDETYRVAILKQTPLSRQTENEHK
ncbi:hypothetical protein XELAEV_18026949mg [Xenopus laevis]|uniref:Uncharacterized protein n=1 Tax=Xenopus laevis TaxID=8355 RepID=A0A974CUP3_XENLA|nr:hypothetical protein XELAEV_18026949mg [Xenopus laevis]